MVSITRRDGTLMDASSILEEDIIELCVKRGHTHPLGMLHYSAVESVVLFLTTDNLKCVIRAILPGDTKLHDEAITVKTMAPTEAHMSAYATVWHAKPSKGGGRPCTPPQQTPTGGETLHCLHVELSDLNNHELHQLVTDLSQEFTCSVDWLCPPAAPSKWLGMPIRQPRAQRGWPRGHLSRRGRVGSTETTHPGATSWSGGSSWTTPKATMSCTSRT